jgi:hypothetical protein
MKIKHQKITGTFALAAALALCPTAGAQQAAPSAVRRLASYDLSREVSLQGTIVQYSSSSSASPLGAHATVQTSSGTIDVHLGNPRLLDANHVSLAAGDSIRIIGENVTTAQGTQFLARILIKGNQQVALRTVRGLPFVSSHQRPSAGQSNVPEGGVR